MSKYAYSDINKTKKVCAEKLNINNYKNIKFYCYNKNCNAVLTLSNGVKGGSPFFKSIPSKPHIAFCNYAQIDNSKNNIDNYLEEKFNFEVIAKNIINNNIPTHSDSIYTLFQLVKLIHNLKGNENYNNYSLKNLTINKDTINYINNENIYSIIKLKYRCYDANKLIIKCNLLGLYSDISIKFIDNNLFKKIKNKLYNTNNDFFIISYWNIKKEDKNFIISTNIKNETQFYFSK